MPTNEAVGVEEHHDEHAENPSARELLEHVMAGTGADPTATETLRLAVTEHAGLLGENGSTAIWLRAR